MPPPDNSGARTNQSITGNPLAWQPPIYTTKPGTQDVPGSLSTGSGSGLERPDPLTPLLGRRLRGGLQLEVEFDFGETSAHP